LNADQSTSTRFDCVSWKFRQGMLGSSQKTLFPSTNIFWARPHPCAWSCPPCQPVIRRQFPNRSSAAHFSCVLKAFGIKGMWVSPPLLPHKLDESFEWQFRLAFWNLPKGTNFLPNLIGLWVVRLVMVNIPINLIRFWHQVFEGLAISKLPWPSVTVLQAVKSVTVLISTFAPINWSFGDSNLVQFQSINPRRTNLGQQVFVQRKENQ